MVIFKTMLTLNKKTFFSLVFINIFTLIVCFYVIIVQPGFSAPDKKQIEMVKSKIVSYEKRNNVVEKPSVAFEIFDVWKAEAGLVSSAFSVIKAFSLMMIALSVVQLTLLLGAAVKKQK